MLVLSVNAFCLAGISPSIALGIRGGRHALSLPPQLLAFQ